MLLVTEISFVIVANFDINLSLLSLTISTIFVLLLRKRRRKKRS